jgi:hypothetical protein
MPVRLPPGRRATREAKSQAKIDFHRARKIDKSRQTDENAG